MTLDAMHWVWHHSKSKGNVRLALLIVADKVMDTACTTRVGTTEFRIKLGNVDKSVVVRTLDRALKSDELVMVEEARGTRPAKYWLPLAANYRRPKPDSGSPDFGPLEEPRGGESPPVGDSQRWQIATANGDQGWQIATPAGEPRGGDLPPEGWQIATPRGGDLPPLYQSTTPTRSASQLEGELEARTAAAVPDFARPLVDLIGNAGYDTLRWNLKHQEWLIIHALINNHGTERLARYAVEQCQQRQISYGKYFLNGWCDLPPAPEPNPDGMPSLTLVRSTPTPPLSPQAARREASREAVRQLGQQLRAGTSHDA